MDLEADPYDEVIDGLLQENGLDEESFFIPELEQALDEVDFDHYPKRRAAKRHSILEDSAEPAQADDAFMFDDADLVLEKEPPKFKRTNSSRRAQVSSSTEGSEEEPEVLDLPVAKSTVVKPAKAKTVKSVEVQPVKEKPIMAKPAEAKPAAANPAKAKPVEAKPPAEKSAAVKPTEAKPALVKPVAVKSAALKPAAVPAAKVKSTAVKPAELKSAAMEAATVKPAAVKPAAVKTAAVKPVAVKPVAVPAKVKSAAVKPAELKSAAMESATVKPAAVKPAAVKSAAVKSAAVKPAELKPAAVKSAAVKPAEARPVEEKPAKTKLAESTSVEAAGKPAEEEKPANVPPTVPSATEIAPEKVFMNAFSGNGDSSDHWSDAVMFDGSADDSDVDTEPPSPIESSANDFQEGTSFDLDCSALAEISQAMVADGLKDGCSSHLRQRMEIEMDEACDDLVDYGDFGPVENGNLAVAASRPRNGADAKGQTNRTQHDSAGAVNETFQRPPVNAANAPNKELWRAGDVFSPMPSMLGSYSVELWMEEFTNASEEAYELLSATLKEGSEEVGALSGLYVLRDIETDFAKTVSAASPEYAPLLQSFFDATGKPKLPMRQQLGVKARSGGFLLIRDVRLKPRVRGKGIGLDFVETVTQRLAGPMKRVTLLVCNVFPAEDQFHRAPGKGGKKALQSYWETAGFQRAVPGKDLFTIEPREFRLRGNLAYESSPKPKKALPKPKAKIPSISTSTGAARNDDNSRAGTSSSPELLRKLAKAKALQAATHAPVAIPAKLTTVAAEPDPKRRRLVDVLNMFPPLAALEPPPTLAPNPDAGTGELFLSPSVPVPASSKSSLVFAPASGFSSKLADCMEPAMPIFGDAADIGWTQVPPTGPAMLSLSPKLSPRRKTCKEHCCPLQQVDFSTGLGNRVTPRIYLALASAVEVGGRALVSDETQFTNGSKGGEFWGSHCFPHNLRKNVYKAFVRGVAEIVRVIGTLLERRQVPSVPVIMQIISPFTGRRLEELGMKINRHVVSHFFCHDGRIEYVVRAIISQANAIYDAHENEADACELGGNLSKIYHSLPINMLDGDFDFVQSVLIPCAE